MERESLVRVCAGEIDAAALLAGVSGPGDGAALLFVGTVRNVNQGQEVTHLDYEAYAPMAERVLAEIAAEARSRWNTGAIAIHHRVGRLEIGQVSVAVAVAAPHRAEAYAASRYVMEELKKRVPIWKREGYAGGASEWLRGSPVAVVRGGSSE